MVKVVGVCFREAGKIYYFHPANFDIAAGDNVIVETARGMEFGTAVIVDKDVTDNKYTSKMKSVTRLADDADFYIHAENLKRAQDALDICKIKIKEHHLEMKLVDCEYTFDGSKIVFYFTAEDRIDFRMLVKDLASIFRTRIELRQIGVRDQAKMIGGLGQCGQQCCCSRFLDEFSPVSIKMAKEQSLSLNPTKISGTCGRLMCCLNYEQEVYRDHLKDMPRGGALVSTIDGEGIVVETNTLQKTVKVRIRDENGTETVDIYSVVDITVLKKGTSKKSKHVPVGKSKSSSEQETSNDED